MPSESEKLIQEIKRLKKLVEGDEDDFDEEIKRLEKLTDPAEFLRYLKKEKKRLEKLTEDDDPEDLTQADIDATPFTFSEGRQREESAIRGRLKDESNRQRASARVATVSAAHSVALPSPPKGPVMTTQTFPPPLTAHEIERTRFYMDRGLSTANVIKARQREIDAERKANSQFDAMTDMITGMGCTRADYVRSCVKTTMAEVGIDA